MKIDPVIFAAEALAAFDARPDRDRAASVTLTQYTEKEWQLAPERFGTLEEAQEVNRLIAIGMAERGVEVKFVGPTKLEVALDIKGNSHPEKPMSGVIGWAVFETRKKF